METRLVYGFLEAGKTSYIQDCILHDYFHKYGTTLILCFEQGGTEYDETALSAYRTTVAYYEGGEDITAFCAACIQKYDPGRIYVEMNTMMPDLRAQFPETMEIAFTTTLFDTHTLTLYLNNLRQYVNDMVKLSDTVTFRSCASKEMLQPHSRIFRMMNPKAVYLRQDPMGYHEKAFDLFLPYSTDGPEIRIRTEDFIAFWLDAGEHPQRYDEKRILLEVPLELRRDVDTGGLRCGRTVMTCCMADLQFMSFPILEGSVSVDNKEGWITAEVRGTVRTGAYGVKKLAFLADSISSAAAPDPYLLKA